MKEAVDDIMVTLNEAASEVGMVGGMVESIAEAMGKVSSASGAGSFCLISSLYRDVTGLVNSIIIAFVLKLSSPTAFHKCALSWERRRSLPLFHPAGSGAAQSCYRPEIKTFHERFGEHFLKNLFLF